MEITAALAHQLQILDADPDGGIEAKLNELSRDLTGVVPSCLAVSFIVLARLGGQITVSTLAPGAASVPVLASLAVPLSAVDPGDLLILRAGVAGAFLLLADDLGALPHRGHLPIHLDRHLSLPSSLTGQSLADFGTVNQAIGVLLDQGFPPEAARQELQHRADDAAQAVTVTSRGLLQSLSAA